MKRAPAVFLTTGDVDDVAARGCGLVLRGVRYYPGQELYVLNEEEPQIALVRVVTATAGPIESLSREQLHPVGYVSRGSVLDDLEDERGEAEVSLSDWVSILTWEPL